MHPTLTLPNSSVYQSSDRTDYRQDWLNSPVDPGIIDLNVEAIAGADLFDFLYPKAERLNTGRLNAKYLRLWERCVDFDNTPLSHGWICNGRVKILEGPILTPDDKGKINKYRNPKGGNAPITFLKVPFHIWEKVAARHGVAMPENISISDDGEALGFWDWVIENRVPVKLTEGEKKAGCLLTLGFAAVSIPGISMGWRVTNRDFKGKAIARELHPDLLPFDDGREITIAFDYRPGDYFKSTEWVNAAILGRLFKNSTVKIARLPGPEKGVDDFAIAGGDVAKVLARAETLRQLQDDNLWRSGRGFSPDKVVNQRYLDIEAFEPGKITAIDSKHGTGKTRLLEVKVAPLPGKQINIGYRNSLLLQMAEKLGSYHLDEHDGRRFFEDPNARISLCVDSLTKLPPEIFKDAHLIFDEAPAVKKHLLTSSTCRENRLEILDFLSKVGPTVRSVTAMSANLKDSDINYLEKIFKMPSVKIKNQFKGDTPPVIFLELAEGRQRISKKEFEALAQGILRVSCPAIASDSLNNAEALYKMFTAQSKKGILLSSKTATKKWAKEFLKNPDDYIRKHKPQFIIFTPTAESGLDISIKEKIDNLDISGNYFSDVFCIFSGVIGVDECLQMSRRVRHPDKIIICCAERKYASKDDSNPFGNQLINVIEERVSIEALSLSPDESSEAIKQAIKAQIDSPHLEQWAKIKANDAVEGRNLRRFVLKSFEDDGYQVSRLRFSDLLLDEFENQNSFASAKKLCKEEEAKQIFDADFIDLEEAQRIEKDFNSQWEDRAKAIKFRLLARLPGIENTELWTWEFVYRLRFKDRDLLNQLEAFWNLENTADADYLKRRKWDGDFKTFIADLSDRWLKLKVLEKLGINRFLDPAAVWTDESPEVIAIANACRSKSIANLLGHPGKLSPIQYLNRLLKIIGVQLIGTQARNGGDCTRQYRYQVEGKKSSRPENWDELYPLICNKNAEKMTSAKMAETSALSDFEGVTPEAKIEINIAADVTPPPIEKVGEPAGAPPRWLIKYLGHLASEAIKGLMADALVGLKGLIERWGIQQVLDAVDVLPEDQRLIIESLG